MYSQICLKWSPKGPKISGRKRQIWPFRTDCFNMECTAEGQNQNGHITQNEMAVKGRWPLGQIWLYMYIAAIEFHLPTALSSTLSLPYCVWKWRFVLAMSCLCDVMSVYLVSMYVDCIPFVYIGAGVSMVFGVDWCCQVALLLLCLIGCCCWRCFSCWHLCRGGIIWGWWSLVCVWLATGLSFSKFRECRSIWRFIWSFDD
jgi:hypothetical protein